MNITSEQAFDMLPYVVDIYKKLDIKKYINDKRIKNKGKANGKTNEEVQKLQNDLGEEAIMYIVKNSGKVKNEFFSIVAICQGIKLDEAKGQSPIKTAATFISIFKDKELLDFFKQAMH